MTRFSHTELSQTFHFYLHCKVIETAVANHLMKHFDEHQSAYHPSHSFQTALQHVYSSVLHQLDRCRAGFIVLIDLSAAFDSVL